MRPLPLLGLLVLAALASCFRPKGECRDSGDCMAGTHCSDGLCLSDEGFADLFEPCGVEQDCLACCTCSAGACALLPDHCRTSADCEDWATCSGFACVPLAGRCATVADCPEWKQCVGHTCTLTPGRCDANADCAAWQYCEVASHRCTDVGAACPEGTGCTSWQTCTAGHCANQPDRCARTAECDPAWQVCRQAEHSCGPAAGRCATSADCDPSYQDCAPTHFCVLQPGRCGSTADCEPWEGCASHECALLPGRCADDSGCGLGQCCAANHSCGPASEVLGAPGPCKGTVGTSPTIVSLYQTFVAGPLPVLEAVTLRLSRVKSSPQPSLSLYTVGEDHKPVEQLTSATLSLTGPLEEVRVPLRYDKLVAGKEYAVVVRANSTLWNGVGWCTVAPPATGSFGTFGNRSTTGGWTVDVWAGPAWLQVQTACR